MYQYSSIPVLLHHIKKWFTVIRTFKTMLMHAYISNLNKSYICSVNKLKGKSVTLSIIKFSSLTLKSTITQSSSILITQKFSDLQGRLIH